MDYEAFYDHFVLSLKKPGGSILKSLTADRADLWHMVTLLSGEAGELLDAVKKTIIYDRRMDVANVVEELGDIEFALSGIRSILNITRQEVLEANVDKLTKRYPTNKYTDEDANARQDKEPGPANHCNDVVSKLNQR